MRRVHQQARRLGRRGFRRFDIREEIAIGSYVPDPPIGRLFKAEQPEQSKAGLELKNQEITGAKILGHIFEVSISSPFANKIDVMISEPNHAEMLAVAIEEAEIGFAEGGIPIGAALFDASGTVLGRGHNRRVQEDDPSVHGETDAFRKAGRQRSYKNTTMVTTLAPCWYCSGLVRQFGIGTVIVGESRTFQGGIDWLRECGVRVIDMDSKECVDLLASFISKNPEIWNEDIGED